MFHIRAALFELSTRQTELVQQKLIGFAHIEPWEIVITPDDDAYGIHFLLGAVQKIFFFFPVGAKSNFGKVRDDHTLKFSILL